MNNSLKRGGGTIAYQQTANDGYVGSAACKTCHQSIYESHIKTAHYVTSRPASKEFIKGSFEAGRNKYVYNKFMEVVLETENDSFFQTGILNGAPYETESMDIVVGSGRKGQTFLYWDSGALFQLPVSYFTPLNSWCNSPGYTNKYIQFKRPIAGQCLECHGTHAVIKRQEKGLTILDKDRILFGVDCERCHGPGRDHIAFQENHPGIKTAAYILNAKKMSRQQQLDACAFCHSGFRKEIKPVFTFQPGEKLDEYSMPSYNPDSTASLDVHGNQYGLLTASKCFKKSAQLNCSSCHNVHENEVNNPKLFSNRCLSCHNAASDHTCTVPATKGLVIADNCIDCHMPALPSRNIFLKVSDPEQSAPDLVRTHRVGIYPASTKTFLEKLRR